MSDVQIPDTAYEAADKFFAGKTDEDDLLGAIDEAAPFIVAAELRRMAAATAASIDKAAAELDVMTAGTVFHRQASDRYVKLAYHYDQLLDRAAELEAGA